MRAIAVVARIGRIGRVFARTVAFKVRVGVVYEQVRIVTDHAIVVV